MVLFIRAERYIPKSPLAPGGNSGFFDYDLRGTWLCVEKQSGIWSYSLDGTLVITMDSIKISGNVWNSSVKPFYGLINQPKNLLRRGGRAVGVCTLRKQSKTLPLKVIRMKHPIKAA
jgi:hypothetical protein